MNFVFVPPGTFQMGSLTGKNNRELPVHEVTLPGFAVGMYEVTFAQYDAFCEATGREKPSDEGWGRKNRPVINVRWDDANAYAAWLSKETGLSFSLPSEAQWEYFARAGTTSRYWTGDSLEKGEANCSDCGSKWDDKMTAPVGYFKHNPWRIYDTAGNVHEWCLDDLHRTYQGAPTDGQAWFGGDEQRKVNRGGAWNSAPRYLASHSRDYREKDIPRNSIGFRLVLEQFDITPQ
jgi:formylglycine-generating enzyme required for sulfatase activity